MGAARLYGQAKEWPSAFRAIDEACWRLRAIRESHDVHITHWTELLGEALLLSATGAAETGERDRLDASCAEAAALVTDPVLVNRSGRLILLAAEISEKAGRASEAIGYYRRWLDYGAVGDDASVQWSISALAQRLENWDECAEAALLSARDYLERGEPGSARLGFLMAGRALITVGRYGDAISALEQCRELYSATDSDLKEVHEIEDLLAIARKKTLFRRRRR